MTATPRVSVLLPVRNGMPWLPQALASLSRQTFADFEIIAVEDGSTDATAAFLASWPDRRLRVVSTGGVGIAAALNAGLAAARGALVARHDADDQSAPGRLEHQVGYLDRHGDVGIVSCVTDYIDDDDRPVDNAWVRTIRRQQDPARSPSQIRKLMPLTCCITHGSVLARTELLTRAGGYRAAMSPAEDYDLWLRLLPDVKFAKLSRRLYRYRIHPQQSSTLAKDAQTLRTIEAKLAYLRRVCPHLPSSARMTVVGNARGNRCYQTVAPSQGFLTTTEPATLGDEYRALLGRSAARRWAGAAFDSSDVLVVTEFSMLDAYRDVLDHRPHAGVVTRVGNFFVLAPRRSKAA